MLTTVAAPPPPSNSENTLNLAPTPSRHERPVAESKSSKWRAGRDARAATAGKAPSVYFPKPLPGETVYSLVARYRSHRGFGHTSLCIEMFGEEIRVFSATMPFRLSSIAARMPKALGYDAGRLLHEHTAFNYYTVFADEHARKRVAEEMIGRVGKAVATVGAWALPIGSAECLRFCPDCNEEATKEYGEAYWRQAHQLPIATMCPDHQCALKLSLLSASGIINAFLIADGVTCPVDAPTAIIDSPLIDRGLLMKLSSEAALLLAGHYPDGVPREWGETRFLQNLDAKGYLFAKNRIRWEDFRAAASSALGGITPVFPGIEEDGRVGPWLLRLRERFRPDHPDRVLLAAHVILAMARRTTAFGAGPWPCLNPLADHHGRDVVTEMEITRVLAGRTTARFSCDCGYIYTQRLQADGSSDEPKISEYGPLLDELIRHAAAKRWSLRKACMAVGVSPVFLLRHAENGPISRPWKARAGSSGKTKGLYSQPADTKEL